MKELSKLNQGIESYNKLFFESIRKELMMTGIKLKIFNILTKPLKIEKIINLLNTDIQNTIYFLDALTAGGFIDKKDGLYFNTSQTQIYLVEGTNTYIGEYLKVQEESKTPILKNMLTLLKNGKPTIKEKEDYEKLGAKMIKRCANVQKVETVKLVSKLISKLPEFPKFQKMLDFGGGSGLICIEIVSKHPSMKGVVFDLPLVIDVTKEFIIEYKMEKQIKTIKGDYFKDSIGDGYDLIWASMTLNFAKDNIDKIMKKIFLALNPNGVFINLNDGLIQENTKPDTIVLNWLAPALMGGTYALKKGFIANSMNKVGFKSVESKSIETHIGVMDIDIARK